jgi:hypothetical protein
VKTHRLLVPAIAAAQFALRFMISGAAVALPAMGADLAAGATALSLVETVFLAASVYCTCEFTVTTSGGSASSDTTMARASSRRRAAGASRRTSSS